MQVDDITAYEFLEQNREILQKSIREKESSRSKIIQSKHSMSPSRDVQLVSKLSLSKSTLNTHGTLSDLFDKADVPIRFGKYTFD